MSLRIVAIVQARLGSTRYPRKVLEPLGNGTVLNQLLRRVSLVPNIDHIVLAPVVGPVDWKAIADRFGAEVRYAIYADENDVLKRFSHVMDKHSAEKDEAVVRLTSDTPLIDPRIIEHCVAEYRKAPCDYYHETGWPLGLGSVEVISAEALRIADQEATDPYSREHVVTWIIENSDRFNVVIKRVANFDQRGFRLCLDEPADLEVIRAVHEALDSPYSIPSAHDIIEWLESHPEIARLNEGVRQLT